MKTKLDFNLALRAIAWGFAYVAERYVIETCLAVLVVGLLGLYALVANNLIMGILTVVVVVLLCAVLNRYGMRVGPPQDDDDSSTG